MLRFFVMLSAVMVFGFSLLSGALLQASTTQALPRALEGFARCELPCWYGFALLDMQNDGGQGLLDAAMAAGYEDEYSLNQYNEPQHTLRAAGRCQTVFRFRYEQTLPNLDFTDCPPLALGDIVNAFGEPEWVAATGNELIYVSTDGMQYIFVRLRTHDWFTWLTPVESITLLNGEPDGFVIFQWDGVMPRKYYCRTQGDEWTSDACV